MNVPEAKALGMVISIAQGESAVETNSPLNGAAQPIETGNRRSPRTKTFLGVAAGLLPATFLADPAVAFRGLSGSQKGRNRRFSSK